MLWQSNFCKGQKDELSEHRNQELGKERKKKDGGRESLTKSNILSSRPSISVQRAFILLSVQNGLFTAKCGISLYAVIPGTNFRASKKNHQPVCPPKPLR